MSDKKIIWIVNPFDPLPGENQHPIRYLYLAQELIDKNCRVVWWTADFCHLTKSYREPNQLDIIDNLKIRSLRVPPYSSNVSAKRFVSHFIFSVKFFLRGFFSNQKPDLIVASLPPLFSPFFAMSLSRLWNIPGIIDVQDLWPDAFHSLKLPRNIAYSSFFSFLYFLRRVSSRLARGITGVSDLYISKLSPGASSAIASFPLGSSSPPLLDISPSVNLPFKKPDDFWLLWGGSVVGHYTDINLIAEAASYFQLYNPSVKFIVTGEGDCLQLLQILIVEKSLKNIFCLGLLKPDDFWALNLLSDIGLCVYKSGAPHSLVNKIYTYMAAGLPVVNSLKGEPWNMVCANNVGLNYSAGNFDDFISKVELIIGNKEVMKSMSLKARALVQQKYTKKAVYSSYAEFLVRMIPSRR